MIDAGHSRIYGKPTMTVMTAMERVNDRRLVGLVNRGMWGLWGIRVMRGIRVSRLE